MLLILQPTQPKVCIIVFLDGAAAKIIELLPYHKTGTSQERLLFTFHNYTIVLLASCVFKQQQSVLAVLVLETAVILSKVG